MGDLDRRTPPLLLDLPFRAHPIARVSCSFCPGELDFRLTCAILTLSEPMGPAARRPCADDDERSGRCAADAGLSSVVVRSALSILHCSSSRPGSRLTRCLRTEVRGALPAHAAGGGQNGSPARKAVSDQPALWPLVRESFLAPRPRESVPAPDSNPPRKWWPSFTPTQTTLGDPIPRPLEPPSRG